MNYLQIFSLVCLSGMAVFSDLRKKKIDNRLIFAGYVSGLIFQIGKYKAAGLTLFLAGALLPVILLWILYFFRMIGAGDIKLFSALSSMLGPSDGFTLIIYSFLAGGCISVGLILRRHNFWRRLQYFFAYFREYSATGQWKPYMDKQDSSSQLYFSVPVFFSVLLYLGGIY